MKRSLSMVGLLVVILASVWLLSDLVGLRISSGDVYPPYSTLRADPLGSRAVFETIGNLPGITAERFLRHPRHLPKGRSTGLWILGLDAWELNGSREELEALDRFAHQGGRVVIALKASSFESWKFQGTLQRTNTPPGSNAPMSRIKSELGAEQKEQISFEKPWGFELKSMPRGNTNQAILSREAHCDPSYLNSLPLSWHGLGYFKPTAPEWRMVAMIDSRVVVMERAWGDGTLVLASDSFLFSNEALRHARAAEFISWLIGESSMVLFNETHHGIQENPGVSTLIRRYHLGYFFAALGILAALFIWQGSVSFLPPSPEAGGLLNRIDGTRAQGRDAVAGLVGLLRRSVPASDLLARCLEEWNRSKHGDRHLSAERLQAIQRLITEENAKLPHQRRPVELYRAIAATLQNTSLRPPAHHSPKTESQHVR